jgi:hypothetical protein
MLTGLNEMSEERGLIDMFKALVVALTAVTIMTLASIAWSDSDINHDERIYNKIATIEGSVTILNHPKLGKTPGSSTYLVFQRLDCKRCVIGTWTDINGHYQIRVGAGKYRLIVREGTREGETRDVLAPTQQRIIDTGNAGTISNLDIEIIVPSAKFIGT